MLIKPRGVTLSVEFGESPGHIFCTLKKYFMGAFAAGAPFTNACNCISIGPPVLAPPPAPQAPFPHHPTHQPLFPPLFGQKVPPFHHIFQPLFPAGGVGGNGAAIVISALVLHTLAVYQGFLQSFAIQTTI